MYHSISPRSILFALVALCFYASQGKKTVDVTVGAGKATTTDLNF